MKTARYLACTALLAALSISGLAFGEESRAAFTIGWPWAVDTDCRPSTLANPHSILKGSWGSHRPVSLRYSISDTSSCEWSTVDFRQISGPTGGSLVSPGRIRRGQTGSCGSVLHSLCLPLTTNAANGTYVIEARVGLASGETFVSQAEIRRAD